MGVFEGCKVKSDEANTAYTMAEIWRHLTWSLLAAYVGKFPVKDALNRPWSAHSHPLGAQAAGGPLTGCFTALWSFKGDLEYFAKSLHLRHYQANGFCEFCPATYRLADPGLVWTNFGPTSSWKGRCFSKAEWEAIHPSPHWLFKVFPFFVSIQH